VTAASRWMLPLSGVQRIFAAFFLYSFCLGGLYPRIGEIQLAMGVGEGALGLALIGPKRESPWTCLALPGPACPSCGW
jgi:hypothetical protein